MTNGPATPPKKYRKRSDAQEVTASVFDAASMMVKTGEGPELPMSRDLFFELYEEVEPDSLPETEGALAKAPPLPHDVATTALLEPKGDRPAQPAPTQTDTEAQADQAAGEASEEVTPTKPQKKGHR